MRHRFVVEATVGLTVLLVASTFCGCEAEVPYQPPPRRDAIPSDTIKVTPETDDHSPILHSDEFLPPEPVSGLVNTAGAEDSAFVMPDGKTLYYWFTPDVTIPPEKQLLDGVTGIYISHNTGSSWSDGQRVLLQDPDKASLDGCVYVGNGEMWFCSAREGNYRGMDMWLASGQNGTWSDWTNAGELLNVSYQVGEMHITADGQHLYFHSDRPGGVGGRDIWVTQRQGESWGPPENVTAVNTPDMDGWPFVTDDGNELWITRTHMGTPGLFRSMRGPEGWQEPELVVSQFAGEASLDRDGNLYFTHHFFRNGEMLEADIYFARAAT